MVVAKIALTAASVPTNSPPSGERFRALGVAAEATPVTCNKKPLKATSATRRRNKGYLQIVIRYDGARYADRLSPYDSRRISLPHLQLGARLLRRRRYS